jgi:hypothetical protein
LQKHIILHGIKINPKIKAGKVSGKYKPVGIIIKDPTNKGMKGKIFIGQPVFI